jgi:hypothetical protein
MTESQVILIKAPIYMLFIILNVKIHIRIRIYLFKKLWEEYEIPLLFGVIVSYSLTSLFVCDVLFH